MSEFTIEEKIRIVFGGAPTITGKGRYHPHRPTDEERQKVLECTSIYTSLGPRSLAPYLWDEYSIPISSKTIYNILKAQGWIRQRKQGVYI